MVQQFTCGHECGTSLPWQRSRWYKHSRTYGDIIERKLVYFVRSVRAQQSIARILDFNWFIGLFRQIYSSTTYKSKDYA